MVAGGEGAKGKAVSPLDIRSTRCERCSQVCPLYGDREKEITAGILAGAWWSAPLGVSVWLDVPEVIGVPCVGDDGNRRYAEG